MRRGSVLALLVTLVFLYLLAFDPAPGALGRGEGWRAAWFTSRVDWREVGRLLVDLRALPLAVALGFLILQLWIRAWRWRIIVAPLDRVPVARMFHLTNLGYMANNILPMRLGEVLRAGALAARSRVPFAGAFATIVLERVLDMIGAMACLLVMLVLLRGPDMAAGLADADALAALARFRALAPYLGLTIAAALALLLFLVIWRHHSLALVESLLNRLLPAGPAARLHRLFASFSAGLDVLRSPGEAVLLLALTALVNACYLGSLAGMVSAYGLEGIPLYQQAPLASLFLLLVFVSLGYMIPAAPGAFGTVQYFTALAIGFVGAGREQALSFALGNHLITWLVLTALGLLALPALRLHFADLMQWKEKRA